MPGEEGILRILQENFTQFSIYPMTSPAPRIKQSNMVPLKYPIAYLHVISIPTPAISKIRGVSSVFRLFFTFKCILNCFAFPNILFL